MFHVVSIHALLAECDLKQPKDRRLKQCFNPRTPCGVRLERGSPPRTTKTFQSTHSLRSATGSGILSLVLFAVSIHALLAECDTKTRFCIICIMRFNPRTPCGVRHPDKMTILPHNWFQSTHSLRSATRNFSAHGGFQSVSIHALLAECDCARPYTWLLNRANHTLRQPP